jgi:hypothetical protein
MINIKKIIAILFLFFSGASFGESSRYSELMNEKSVDWKIYPLMSVGDHSIKNHFRLVGTPDGLGVEKENNFKIMVYMNHEIANDKGIVRSHGGRGAFVSQWTLDLNLLKIISGEDLIKKVMIWNRDKKIFEVSPNENLNRLCSADLPEKSAFYNSKNKKGFDGRIFMNGEEDREGGRAFAHIVSGKEKGISYELPYLGKFSWENVVAHPNTKDKTIVMGMDDNKEGQVYLYLGSKQSKGNPVERAGLMYGKLFGIKTNADKFELVDLDDVSNLSGSDLEKKGMDSDIAKFKRPEDGAWDTLNPNVFYFTTTDKIDGDSEIIKLTFHDINHPEQGGAIEAILKARDIGAQMFDNLTVSDNGKIIINEDPGDHEHLASVWDFDPRTKVAQKIFEVKPEYFQDKSHPNFLTMDEEHSGIIDITRHVTHAPWYKKSERYFLGTLQIHKKLEDPELVEGGQLYFISGPK